MTINRRTFFQNSLLGALAASPQAASASVHDDSRAAVEGQSKLVTVYSGVPIEADQATLLAIDDVSIPFRQNLFLQMYAAARCPENPVVRRGEKGKPDDYCADYYGTVLRQDGKYRMWYFAYDDEATDALMQGGIPTGQRLAYAESEDGIHWVKPNLGLVNYRGNKNNNLLAVDPPDFYGLAGAILYDLEETEPSRQFKMMMSVRSYLGQEQVTTSVPLYSADGFHWRVAVPGRPANYAWPAENFVLPPEHFEQSGLYKWQGIYHLTGQQLSPWVWLPDGQRCGRVMTIFRSPDFLHWSSTKTLAYVRYGYRSAAPEQGEEAHLPASMWNRGNVLLGTFGLFHGGPGAKYHPIDMGLMISNDGIHFREPLPDFALLRRGEASWESHGLVTGQGFEEVGDQTYLWYTGWDNDVTRWDTHAEIGLATLRRDSFGSLSPKYPSDVAALITCPLKLKKAARLWINAEGLSKHACLRVELLDLTERSLPSYAGDNSLPLRQSGLRIGVTWRDADQVKRVQKPFRIKVDFEGQRRAEIKFYGVYVSE
jgi:hypothetical protein